MRARFSAMCMQITISRARQSVHGDVIIIIISSYLTSERSRECYALRAHVCPKPRISSLHTLTTK